MSKHATIAMLETMEQQLLELIADFLDSEDQKLNEVIAHIKDPMSREDSELHIQMAKAAMDIYKSKTVLYDGRGVLSNIMSESKANGVCLNVGCQGSAESYYDNYCSLSCKINGEADER